jgi:hypothetical protein
MSTLHATGDARTVALGRRARLPRALAARAHLHAGRLDGELAKGVPTWTTPVHAARALQLTSARRRRHLARALERLLAEAQRPPAPLSSAIPPSRPQVRDALPQILAVSASLRSVEPVSAQGTARLRALLRDGSSPCFVNRRPGALADALEAVLQCLAQPS